MLEQLRDAAENQRLLPLSLDLDQVFAAAAELSREDKATFLARSLARDCTRARARIKVCVILLLRNLVGGEGGIRTHVPVTRQDAFEAPPLRPLRYLSGLVGHAGGRQRLGNVPLYMRQPARPEPRPKHSRR